MKPTNSFWKEHSFKPVNLAMLAVMSILMGMLAVAVFRVF
jgi:hypothetical protein